MGRSRQVTWRTGNEVPSSYSPTPPTSDTLLSPLKPKMGRPKRSVSPRNSSPKSPADTSVGAIKALDLDSIFEESEEPRATSLVQSAVGARWDLPEAAFLRWWRALAEEDRGEFIAVYGGDNVLARFVCALDYLTTMEARPQSGATIVDAYAIAAELPHDSEAARRGAVTCWKHDAVQALLDRLRYRSARQAAARITNKATAVIESMLAEATNTEVELKDKAKVVQTALAFMRMVSDEDVQERVERTKRGFVRARQELDVTKNEIEQITPDQAALHMKVLRDQLGAEAFEALAVETVSA